MPRDIGRAGLQRLRAQAAAIVEVLPRTEFDQEHIAGALSLPLEDMRADAVHRALGGDRQRPIVTYCHSVD